MAAPEPPSSAPTLAQQLLDHKPVPYSFSFTPFLQKTYGHGLPPDQKPTNASSAAASSNPSYNSLVCKHWLRALCKKGESCEFLHEYNLRKMPECNFFVRNGYCSNGDECLYLHIDPQSKLPPCPWYDSRGFCPLGPKCSKKHVRRKMCPYYMAGFCPDGRNCKEGAHPKWEKESSLPKPTERSEKPEEDVKRDEGVIMEEETRREDKSRGDRFGGGRGGRWKGRGGRGFRGGRGHH